METVPFPTLKGYTGILSADGFNIRFFSFCHLALWRVHAPLPPHVLGLCVAGLAILIEGSAVLLFDRQGVIRGDFTERGAGIKVGEDGKTV